MRLKILLFQILLLVTFATQIQSQCNAISCENITAGTYISDPISCTEYYLCLEDEKISDVTFACDDEEYFEEDEQKCVNVEGNRCTLDCPPVSCNTTCTFDFEQVAISGNCNQYEICIPSAPGDYTKSKADCLEPTPYFDSLNKMCIDFPNNCCNNDVTYCYDEYVQIPYPGDCSKFYVCYDIGVPIEEDSSSCAVGEFFDDETNTCEIDTNNECIPPL